MFLSSLVFPPLCVHCEMVVQKKRALFCDECSFFFEPMEWTHRCPYCGCNSERNRPCASCKEAKRAGYKVAATLEYQGAVFSFYSKLHEGKMPYLAKTGASLLLLQLMELKWELPDSIIAAPLAWKKRMWGRNPAALLTRYLRRYLGVSRASKIEDKVVLVIASSLEKAPELMESVLKGLPRKAYLLALTNRLE